MNNRAPKKLRLSRETVRQLDHDDLGKVAGGQMQTAGTCPVSACICVTGEVCQLATTGCAIQVTGICV
jgi:hypothetical protein